MDQKSPNVSGPPLGSNQRIFGSDVIAHALRELEIPYACLNPGASYRGLHDSMVNFLGNERPKMVVNLHEEHAVAMAHGYAKVTDRPLFAIVHSNVGLLHATMAIFNAWVDRHPMIILGATGPLDASLRRPHIDWIHTSQDQGAIIRDYIKWDDQPGSPEAAVEAIRKGYQIACTPPYGPVYINLDVTVQEMELERWPDFEDVSRFTPPPPPGVPEGAVEKAVEMIKAAKNPLMLCGRIARNEKAWNDRIKLAEIIGAKTMVNTQQEIGFPMNHPSCVGMCGFYARGIFGDAHRESDLVIGLDWFDLGGTLRNAWDGGRIEPKVISCTMDFHQHRGWVKDFGAEPPVDLNVPTTPEIFVADLLKALDGEKPKSYPAKAPLDDNVPAKGPIGVVELARVWRQVARDKKICMVSHTIGWPSAESDFSEYMSFLGSAGGAGLGAGPGNAVGAALALRDRGDGYIPVSFVGDGDYLMGVQALWTAAHQKIPMLLVVANNNSYFNDEMHQEAVANLRDRPPENRWIGQKINEPDPDIAALARAQGLEAPEPVRDVADFAQALEDALEKVKNGASMVLDVRVTPEYATTPVHQRKSK